MRGLQTDVNADAAGRVVEKTIEERHHLLLLLQRVEQLAHVLPGEVKIETDQMRSAIHRQLRIGIGEEAFLAEHREVAQNFVVAGALFFNAGEAIRRGRVRASSRRSDG